MPFSRLGYADKCTLYESLRLWMERTLVPDLNGRFHATQEAAESLETWLNSQGAWVRVLIIDGRFNICLTYEVVRSRKTRKKSSKKSARPLAARR